MNTRSITYGDSVQFSMGGSRTGEERKGYQNYALTLADPFKGMDFSLEHLREGMSLLSSSFRFTEDTTFPFKIDKGAFSFSTILSGATSGSTEMTASAPCSKSFLTNELEGETRFMAGQHQSVGVHVDKKMLLDMIAGDERFEGLENTLSCRYSFKLLGDYALSPETRLLAGRILGCTLRGSIRKLFLEGITLELLSIAFERLVEGKTGRSISLSRGDVERIHEARRLLVEDMTNPPGIKDLSRQVGINEFKLKRGFRELFGDSIYRTLRAHRMEAARSLLEDTDMTVAMVGSTVGYCNMSHFSSAFRGHFGVNPGELLSHRRHIRFS